MATKTVTTFITLTSSEIERELTITDYYDFWKSKNGQTNNEKVKKEILFFSHKSKTS